MDMLSFERRRCGVLAFFLTLCSGFAISAQEFPPYNARAYRLPAEVLVRWDAVQGGTRYWVYSGGINRRWKPISTNVTATWYHDTTYAPLPGYYQVAAFGPSGFISASPEFLVSDTPPTLQIWSVALQMLDATTASIRWAVRPDLVDGQVEIGTSPTSFEVASVSSSELRADHSLLVEGLDPGAQYWYRITSTKPGEGVSYVNHFMAEYTNAPITLQVSSGIYPNLTTKQNMLVPFTMQHVLPLTAPVFTIIPSPFAKYAVVGASPTFIIVPQLQSTDGGYVRWEVRDGDFFDTGEFHLVIAHVNQRPIALDQTVNVTEDVGGLRLELQAMDPDFNVALIVRNPTIVSGPTNGTIRTNLFGEFLYWPATNFTGVDHLIFTASDQEGQGSYGKVRCPSPAT